MRKKDYPRSGHTWKAEELRQVRKWLEEHPDEPVSGIKDSVIPAVLERTPAGVYQKAVLMVYYGSLDPAGLTTRIRQIEQDLHNLCEKLQALRKDLLHDDLRKII